MESATYTTQLVKIVVTKSNVQAMKIYSAKEGGGGGGELGLNAMNI